MKKSEENLVIIDADSIVYIIAYNLKDMQLEPLGNLKIDELIKDILISTKSRNYLGFFAGKKGRNFRKDISVTKVYKGNRQSEKEDWFNFWEPILKARMKNYWKFQEVSNIEADDACSIAANKYRSVYKKVYVASPDKDLFQIPDMWFYNYIKKTTVYCDKTVSNYKLYVQLITGDSSDNIQGCFGAGKSTAEKAIDIIEEKIKLDNSLKPLKLIEDFYVEWNTITIRNKKIKKQEVAYLIQYKKDNNIKRFTAIIKSDALAEFKPNSVDILTEKESRVLYKEMYNLIKLLDTEKEGKKHGFKVGDIIIENCIDWSEIIDYEESLELMPEEIDYDFEEEL